MSVFGIIKSRRSMRDFLEQELLNDDIIKLLEAACWAPSGKNGQPWKFVIVAKDQEVKMQICELSIYQRWLKKVPCLIFVFLDRNISYDYKKDVQAIGASIQNMLLTAEEIGLATCWIGEILDRENDIKNLLEIPESLEMMALIAVGYTNSRANISKRKNVNDCLLLWK